MALHETGKDVANQEQVVAALKELWGWEGKRLAMRYNADYLILKGGKPKAILEVKCYTTDYPNAILTVHKAESCLRYAKRLGVPFVFVVRKADGTIAHRQVFDAELETLPIKWVTNEREHNHNPVEDSDPYYPLPLSSFKTLSKKIGAPIVS